MGAFLATFFIRPHNCSQNMSPDKFEHRSNLPVPKCIHKVLTESDIGDNDVLVIGDVHGCLTELKQVVSQALDETNNKCTFVFCGDIVNKGPLNKETLDYIRTLGNQAHAIRGNHDNHVLEHYFAVNYSTDNSYHGRIYEEKPKYKWIENLTVEDMEYLKELPYTISIPHLHTIVVHAGLFPWMPLCCQDPIVMTKMRNISGMDVLCDVKPEEDINKGVPWASLWSGPEHVYFGHDARRRLQTYHYATGLDTGCVYGGSLTAQYISGKHRGQFISVKSSHTYIKPTGSVKK